LSQNITFYYAVLLVVAVATIAMWRLVNSPFGTALRGIKDSETRMRSLGYNVPLHLFLVFTISGSSPASPVRFMRCSTISSARALWRFSQSVEGLLMAIVGGIGTLIRCLYRSVRHRRARELRQHLHRALADGDGLQCFILIMIFAPRA